MAPKTSNKEKSNVKKDDLNKNNSIDNSVIRPLVLVEGQKIKDTSKIFFLFFLFFLLFAKNIYFRTIFKTIS